MSLRAVYYPTRKTRDAVAFLRGLIHHSIVQQRQQEDGKSTDLLQEYGGTQAAAVDRMQPWSPVAAEAHPQPAQQPQLHIVDGLNSHKLQKVLQRHSEVTNTQQPSAAASLQYVVPSTGTAGAKDPELVQDKPFGGGTQPTLGGGGGEAAFKQAPDGANYDEGVATMQRFKHLLLSKLSTDL